MTQKILLDLYRIEIPLPQNPLKYTNSFVLTSKDRNLIIDTGLNRKECMDAMQAGLDELGLDLDKTDFLITHLHSDHFALATTLAAPDAKIYMGRNDAAHFGNHEQGWEDMAEHSRIGGFPEDLSQAAVKNHPGHKHGPKSIVKLTHLEEGDTITVGDYNLKCIETPGHTRGHICLYEHDKKIFFSGDHVLGDITPNIQAWRGEDNPLGDYIKSLTKVKGLEVSLTLPGHRSLIEDLQLRIKELKVHHLNRCNEVLDILNKGNHQSGYQVSSQMTWDIEAKSWEDFPLMQKWFATGEGLAHLKFLEQRGLVRHETEPDGLITYSLNGDVRLETVD